MAKAWKSPTLLKRKFNGVANRANYFLSTVGDNIWKDKKIMPFS